MVTRHRALKTFGLNVRHTRESRKKLAEKAQLDRTYVSGIERGVRNPGIKTVVHIAKALNSSIGDLCKGV